MQCFSSLSVASENKLYGGQKNDTVRKNGRHLPPSRRLHSPQSRSCRRARYSHRRVGRGHRRFLKSHHRVRYYNLLTAGTLGSYHAELDKRAEKMFADIVKSLAENEGVTEKLKAAAPMEWVQKMNNIRNRATEIVNAEVVYA